MRKVFMLAALSLMLVSCSESNIQKAQKVAALVKENCHIAVNIADVAAALSVGNPAITGVAAMARAICSQAQSSGETGALDHFLFRPVKLAQVEQPEPPPMPNPDPPSQPAEPGTGVVPEPVPLPEPKPKDDDDCVAVINGVCIRKEGDK